MIDGFSKRLVVALSEVTVTGAWSEEALVERLQKAGRLFFVGNGGSAAIASHMATDFSNKGFYGGIALTDLSAITCVANDYGYVEVFARQLIWQANKGDWLFVISSSGRSGNVIKAAEMGRHLKMEVVTLSGFADDNPLRQLGDVNYYVPSSDYGIVETAHLGILHALLERVMK